MSTQPRELIVDENPLKRAFFNGESLPNGTTPLARAIEKTSAPASSDSVANVTAHLAAHKAAGLITGFIGTSNQVFIGTPDPITGYSQLSLPQDINVAANTTFNSVKAYPVQPSNTPTVSLTVAGTGTGASLLSSPAPGSSLFGGFQLFCGTGINGNAIARLAFAAALPITTDALVGGIRVTDVSSGDAYCFGTCIAVDSTHIDLVVDKNFVDSGVYQVYYNLSPV